MYFVMPSAHSYDAYTRKQGATYGGHTRHPGYTVWYRYMAPLTAVTRHPSKDTQYGTGTYDN